MAETLLDKLDAQHDGAARRYLASLYAFGASHEQAAEKLAQEFGIRQPTKRSTGEWRRTDAKLRQMIEQLEAARADLAPDSSPADVLAKIPAPVDPAAAASDLFGVCVQFPAFGELVKAGAVDEVSAVLTAGHESDADVEADCVRRLADFVPIAAPPASDGFYG